jgi:hypothetical protein
MWTAFGCKVVLMGVMLLCMASLIVLYMHNKAEKLAKLEQAKAAKLAQENKIKTEAEEAQIETGKADAMADAIIRVKKETGSAVIANNFAKTATKAEKKPIPIPSANPEPKAVAEAKQEEDPGLGVYEFLLEFSQKHIYYVPTTAHFIAFVLMCFVLVATKEAPRPGERTWTEEEWLRYHQQHFPDSIEVRPTGPLSPNDSGKAQRR